MKPTLKVNKSTFDRPGSTLGMRELLRGIAESDLFDVSFHNENVSAMRGNRATVIYYNDKKIYLDLWEYPTPSHTIEVYNAGFDLIIKVQHRDVNANIYRRYTRRKGLMKTLSDQELNEYWSKFVPWTFFSSGMFKQFVGNEESIQGEYLIERDGFFCGKAWKCRHRMTGRLNAQGIECTKSSQEKRTCRPLNDEEYLHQMRSSKYGIVLRGRSSILTDCKNRREIDYMMLKKPLVLDYQPYYYNPLVAGKHFILIDENTDVKALDKMYNIDEIANNGYEWYKQNASTEAIPKTFLQIMQDKFGKE